MYILVLGLIVNFTICRFLTLQQKLKWHTKKMMRIKSSWKQFSTSISQNFHQMTPSFSRFVNLFWTSHLELKRIIFGHSESPLRINWCINNVLECTKFLSCCIYSSITIILGHYQGFIPLYSASSSWQKTSSLCNQGKNLNLFQMLFNMSKLIPWTGLEWTCYLIT